MTEVGRSQRKRERRERPPVTERRVRVVHLQQGPGSRLRPLLVALAATLVVPVTDIVAAPHWPSPSHGATLPAATSQLDARTRGRVAAATVEVLPLVSATGVPPADVTVPVGSATIVTPEGLLLTAWHVVDLATVESEIQARLRQQYPSAVVKVDPNRVLLLSSNGGDDPTPAWTAQVVAHDAALDLAVLRIIGDAMGNPIPRGRPLPNVPLGDSAQVSLGDDVNLFGFPIIGGGGLTYTSGLISAIRHETGRTEPAWILTDATFSGGSSGGAAVNAAGELIGVPTQGSALDCRPGDSNGDGLIDGHDVGCVPVGGSLGWLRPVNLARSLLASVGYVETLDQSAVPRYSGVLPTDDPPPQADGTNQSSAEPQYQPYGSNVLLGICGAAPVYVDGMSVDLTNATSYRDPKADNGQPSNARTLIDAGTHVEIVGGSIPTEGVGCEWPVKIPGVDHTVYILNDELFGGPGNLFVS